MTLLGCLQLKLYRTNAQSLEDSSMQWYLIPRLVSFRVYLPPTSSDQFTVIDCLCDAGKTCLFSISMGWSEHTLQIIFKKMYLPRRPTHISTIIHESQSDLEQLKPHRRRSRIPTVQRCAWCPGAKHRLFERWEAEHENIEKWPKHLVFWFFWTIHLTHDFMDVTNTL